MKKYFNKYIVRVCNLNLIRSNRKDSQYDLCIFFNYKNTNLSTPIDPIGAVGLSPPLYESTQRIEAIITHIKK